MLNEPSPNLSPISDNFVTGDNVYLNELKNFFFEVLGMMSITHYGCFGDGRYDNYGPLQVAIDDANRRHLNCLYVPYGRYRFRGNLINLNNIAFVGNPKAKIFNDKTGVEIPIAQFGLPIVYKEGEEVKKLTGNIVLTDGSVPTLEGGLYFTGPYMIRRSGDSPLVGVFGHDEVVYYDEETNCFSGSLNFIKYNDGEWILGTIAQVKASVTDDDTTVPLSSAVYDALQNSNTTSTDENNTPSPNEDDVNLPNPGYGDTTDPEFGG